MGKTGPAFTLDRAMPQGIATQIDIPQKPTDVYKVRKKVPGDWYGNPTWGRSFVNIDRYSGKVLSAIDVTKASLGEKIAQGMDIFHFGLFGGIAGRILYFCVGLSPTCLATAEMPPSASAVVVLPESFIDRSQVLNFHAIISQCNFSITAGKEKYQELKIYSESG
jgi:hypothetical protein